jgi:methionyl-tRNA synthetase
MNALEFATALTEIWKLEGDCIRYIDVTQPWCLVAARRATEAEDGFVYARGMRAPPSPLIAPTMPVTPRRIIAQIGSRARCGEDVGIRTESAN